jgi:hypothetical protein
MPADLVAYLASDITESVAASLRHFADQLEAIGGWSLGAPTFVDEVDETVPCTAPEDEPVRTVGLLLRVTRPDEPPFTPASEVQTFVDAVAGFSAKHGVDFEVQLDTTFVGAIAQGAPDRQIRQGLLASWTPVAQS